MCCGATKPTSCQLLSLSTTRGSECCNEICVLQLRPGTAKQINKHCKIDNQGKLDVLLRELKLGLCNNLEGRERVGGGKIQEGGDICVPIANRGMAETKPVL